MSTFSDIAQNVLYFSSLKAKNREKVRERGVLEKAEAPLIFMILPLLQ